MIIAVRIVLVHKNNLFKTSIPLFAFIFLLANLVATTVIFAFFCVCIIKVQYRIPH